MTVQVVYAPFEDGVEIETHVLGHYSSLDVALAWVAGEEYRERYDPGDPEEYVLQLIATEHVLDAGPNDFRRQIAISTSGEVIGEIGPDDDFEEPWEGRDSATCQWQRGDIVSVISGHRYRIGVVLAPPPSPDWIQRHPGIEVTRGDDVYLVGYPGTVCDHSHPMEWEIIKPLDPVPDELRAELERRLRDNPCRSDGL